ncbi:MAG: hypothetical protein RL154_560 [Pseudomonadota bacterium]
MITHIEEIEFVDNRYLHPVKLAYKINGVERTWEAVKSLDSVAVLIYHKEKDSFLFVKQFRAPIVLNANKNVEDAFTYELCAGVCDKDKSLEETAIEEIDEECGYNVAIEKLEFITAFHTCVGISGALQSVFYAEICEEDLLHCGGGDHTEDIELIWVDKNDAKTFCYDLTKPKTPGLIAAIYWWFDRKSQSLPAAF